VKTGKGVYLIYTDFPHAIAEGPWQFNDPNSAGQIFVALQAADAKAKSSYKPHEVTLLVQLRDNLAWGESCPIGTHSVTTTVTNPDGTTTTTTDCVPD